MNARHFPALAMAYIAISVVLIALCSWIFIPAAVPFTLQTFAVFCVLLLLGGKQGTITMLLYISLGAIGMPEYTGFGAGVGVLLGTSSGYKLGYVSSAEQYWAVAVFSKGRPWGRIAGLLLGLCGCYAFGTAWFMQVYSATRETISLSAALSWCVLPFVLPDLIKLSLALLLTRRLQRALPGVSILSSVQSKEKSV